MQRALEEGVARGPRVRVQRPADVREAFGDQKHLPRGPDVVGGRPVELPHFLLLGPRGGGTPVRVAIFGGFDADRPETVHAVSRLLLQYELAPRLARDFAIFGYPIVNATGFAETKLPLGVFERRFAEDRGEDVRFFKDELGKWGFDGVITLASDVNLVSKNTDHLRYQTKVTPAESIAEVRAQLIAADFTDLHDPNATSIAMTRDGDEVLGSARERYDGAEVILVYRYGT